MFICKVCEKTYSSQKSLNNHDRKKHHVYKEICYECNQDGCGQLFNSKLALMKHKTQHRIIGKKLNEFSCTECGNRYKSKKSLNNHKSLKKHNICEDKRNYSKQYSTNISDTYECYHCSLQFPNKSHLISHIKVHTTRSKRILCPVDNCEGMFCKYFMLRDHLSTIHKYTLEEETYSFGSIYDFNQWKTTLEESQKVNYVMDTKKKVLKNGNIQTYYICHRSLAPRTKVNLVRHSKSSGTNKTGRACPSTLTATTTLEGTILVDFFPIHLGHDCNLGRMRINKEERQKIAGKLSQGVTVDRILHDIRDSVHSEEFQRIHLVEKKDISNIMRDFFIGYQTKRHQNDAMSVKLWVSEMSMLDPNPVLFYKEQGEDHDLFKKEDFVLIVMTEFQAVCFRLFGSIKVCIDGTHGLNAYGFQLYTIVVIDEYGSGIPVAFCFSNRADTMLFEVFFKCIRDRIGIISANTFMSDDCPTFYNAWEIVMGGAERQLLCSWHINKNWVQNSSKIADKEKRQMVLKSLRVLQKELDEETFTIQLQNFLDQLKSDPDTLKFFEYFVKIYANRTEMWAYCYRKYIGLNTNMYLESLHKTIKYHYLQGRKCKRLDKSLNALLNLVRDKFFERVIKLEKQKVTDKIKKIWKSHDDAQNIPQSYIEERDSMIWYVRSTTDKDHHYIVEKISENCSNVCELKCNKCNICIHNFKCSCPNNVISHNICKHIHACQKNTESSFQPNTVCESVIPQIKDNPGPSLLPSRSNKNFISSKLEIIQGLNVKCTLSDESHCRVSKYLDKVISEFNLEGNVKVFENEENVNTLCKIAPQKGFFSTKKVKSNPNPSLPYPHQFEAQMIKESLLDNSEVVNIHTTFDHTYV